MLIGSSHTLPIHGIVTPLARYLKAKIPAQKDDFPERLVSALVKSEHVKVGVDVLLVLEDLLKDSGTDLVECHWKPDLNKFRFQSRAERRNNPRRLMQGQSGVYQQERQLVTDCKDHSARPADKKLATSVPVSDTKTSPGKPSTNQGTAAEEGNILKDCFGAHSSNVYFQDIALEDSKTVENSEEFLRQVIYEIETLDITEDKEQGFEISTSDAQEFINSSADDTARTIQRWYRGHRLLRKLKQKKAARVIQRSFRKFIGRSEEDESTAEEQITPDNIEEDESKDESKYVDYFGCRVCGISFYSQGDRNSRDQGETYQAHLKNSSHRDITADYENFLMYIDSSVKPSLVNAEKLIEKADLLCEKGQLSSNNHNVVSLNENFKKAMLIKRNIFRNHQWNHHEKLKDSMEQLHQSCFDLEKHIRTLEQKGKNDVIFMMETGRNW